MANSLVDRAREHSNVACDLRASLARCTVVRCAPTCMLYSLPYCAFIIHRTRTQALLKNFIITITLLLLYALIINSEVVELAVQGSRF